jgi:hypothetical protein
MINITQLTREQTVENWVTLSRYLSKVLPHGQGESSLTDYLTKILNNYAQCWALVEGGTIVGVGLTEFLQYSQHKTLHIIAFSGSNFEEQSKVFPTVEQFAKDNGCKRIESWGRRGWVKQLTRYSSGWKEAYTVMSKDIQ